MKRWISMGLLWAAGGYFLTIILLPVMSGDKLSAYKLSVGVVIWIMAGLAIGNLFYNKQKAATKSRRKKKR